MLNNPFDFFDAIYVINLEKCTERLSQFLKEADEYGFRDRVIVFKAIEDEVGSYGCSMSHLAIVKESKAKGHNNVLVFEDDAIFLYPKEYVYSELNVFIDKLKNKDWNMIQLGANFVWHNYDKVELVDDVLKCISFSGTFAICYNKNCYDHIIQKQDITKEEFMKSNLNRNDAVLSNANMITYSPRYPLCIVDSEESFTGCGVQNSLNAPSVKGRFHFILLYGAYYAKNIINNDQMKFIYKEKMINDYNIIKERNDSFIITFNSLMKKNNKNP